VAEGARLESVYTARYRGFESHSLRHKTIELCLSFRRHQRDIGVYVASRRGLGDQSLSPVGLAP
jgi:hypothetical protein